MEIVYRFLMKQHESLWSLGQTDSDGMYMRVCNSRNTICHNKLCI